MKLMRFVRLFVALIFTTAMSFGAENWGFTSLTRDEAMEIAGQPVLPNTSFSVSGAPIQESGARLEKFGSFFSEVPVSSYYTRGFNLGLSDGSFTFQMRQYTDPNDPCYAGVTYNGSRLISGFEFPDGYTLMNNIVLEVTMPEGVNSSVTIGGKTLNVIGGTKEYCLISGDDGRNDPVSLYTSMNISIDVPEGVPYDNTGIRFKFGFFDTASVPEPGTSLIVLTSIAGILGVRRTHRRA